ncbi:MAG: hypothetical protein D6744_15935 [Planctomycetota bacterium]|nr:MAG: hypothetical protein D6744_15935 [Planctomycetota bacterium]
MLPHTHTVRGLLFGALMSFLVPLAGCGLGPAAGLFFFSPATFDALRVQELMLGGNSERAVATRVTLPALNELLGAAGDPNNLPPVQTQLIVLDLAGGTARALDVRSDLFSAQPATDGNIAAWVSHTRRGGGSVFVVDLLTGETTQYVEGLVVDGVLLFEPIAVDGQHVVLSGFADGALGSRLAVLDLNTGEVALTPRDDDSDIDSVFDGVLRWPNLITLQAAHLPDGSDPNSFAGPPTFALVQIDLTTGARNVLLDNLASSASALKLEGSHVLWIETTYDRQRGATSNLQDYDLDTAALTTLISFTTPPQARESMDSEFISDYSRAGVIIERSEMTGPMEFERSTRFVGLDGATTELFTARLGLAAGAMTAVQPILVGGKVVWKSPNSDAYNVLDVSTQQVQAIAPPAAVANP